MKNLVHRMYQVQKPKINYIYIKFIFNDLHKILFFDSLLNRIQKKDHDKNILIYLLIQFF